MLTQDKVFLKLLIFLLIAISMNAQSETELNAKIDSIDNIIKTNNNQIQFLQTNNINLIIEKNNYLKHISNLQSSSSDRKIMMCKVITTGIYKDENFYYKLYPLNIGDKVEIIESFDETYKIKLNNVIGYVQKDVLGTQNEFDNIIAKKRLHAENEKNRKEELIEKYGEVFGLKIYFNKIAIGMTPRMVIESIGSPNDINKSTGSWGVHEQWVYRNKYLYFENGKLTSWQE